MIEGWFFTMENENNMNQGSTYHFGRNESPYSREDISGKVAMGEQSENKVSSDQNRLQNDIQQTVSQEEVQVQTVVQEQSVPRKQAAAQEQDVMKETTASQTAATYYTMNSDSPTGAYNQQEYNGSAVAGSDGKKKKKKKEKKSSNGKAKKVLLFICAAIAFGLIAGGVMFGVNVLGNHLVGTEEEKIVKEVATVSTTDTISKEIPAGSVADVAEEVMPSIVAITNTSVQTVRSWFQSYEQEVSGSGSGIIIGQTDTEILIATNNHVIAGAKELTVAFSDETAVEATVKGADASTDLAVIVVKIADMDQSTLSSIKVAALGSSEDLRVGESAIAIGNALGYGQSVTVGYISAVNREVAVEDTSMTLLQTDAAINPGNSGGALLNSSGEVIGINTVKFVDSTVEGMGYAIPISKAIPIINDLMNQEVIEESEQGYLGIQGNDITDEYSQGFNMPKGVYVVKIIEGSPADGCGLKAGDIITKFANRDVTSMKNLQSILSNKKAGEAIEMVVQRNTEKGDYEEVILTVVLGAKRDMPEQEEQEEQPATESNNQEEYYYEEINPEDFFDPFGDFYNNY